MHPAAVGTGHWYFSQIIAQRREHLVTNGSGFHFYTYTPTLDGSVIYDSANPTFSGMGWLTGGAPHQDTDSPELSIQRPSDDSAYNSGIYKTYIMFLASGDSEPVPLGYFRWGFYVTVDFVGGQWTVNPGSTNAPSATFHTTTAEPTWRALKAIGQPVTLGPD